MRCELSLWTSATVDDSAQTVKQQFQDEPPALAQSVITVRLNNRAFRAGAANIRPELEA